MRLIQKKAAPREWADYRKDHPPPDSPEDEKRWADLHWGPNGTIPSEAKRALRQALLDEQDGLCAYCQRRISIDGTRGARLTVEHWRARKTHPAQCLDYAILLAVCDGGARPGGTPIDPQQLHCDKRRGHRELTLSPLARAQMEQVRYLAGGELTLADATLDHEAREVLGLNLDVLKRARRAFLEQAQRETVSLLGKKGGWTSRDLEKALAHWQRPREHGVPEYLDVIVRYLTRHPGWTR
jgi:uncharacterized protein (TIGR02646 family)